MITINKSDSDDWKRAGSLHSGGWIWLVVQANRGEVQKLRTFKRKAATPSLHWSTHKLHTLQNSSHTRGRLLILCMYMTHVQSPSCTMTMSRNAINVLYNPDHITLWCLEIGPVVYARVPIVWSFENNHWKCSSMWSLKMKFNVTDVIHQSEKTLISL